MGGEDFKFWLAGLVCFGGLAYLAVDRYTHRSMDAPAVSGAPMQAPIPDARPFRHRDHVIQPVAAFAVRAKLLSAQTYRFDRPAAVSPIDFALGWDDMSEAAVLGRLTLSQSHRYFSYQWQHAPPIAPEAIARSAANMHLIPANASVEERLRAARRGQIVALRGQLVNVQGADGWYWRSSLTREDSGPGACEVMWVESVTLEQ